MIQVTAHENTLKASQNEVLALAAQAARRLGCEVIPLHGKVPAFVAPGKQYSFPSNMLHKPGVHAATKYAWANATGIGILQGNSDLFFIDLDDLALRPRLLEVIPNLDQAYRVRSGKGGEHIYLRGKLPNGSENGLSLRADGHEVASLRAGHRYVAGAGSEYWAKNDQGEEIFTGRYYEAINPEADPLVLTDRQLKALIDLFGAKPSLPSPKPSPSLPSPDGEVQRAVAALAALAVWRADDYHWWIMIGQALKAAFGEAGLPLWDSWSQGSAKYKPGECERKWRGFKRGGITLATIFKAADEDRPNWRKDYAQAARSTVTISRPLHAPAITPSPEALPETQTDLGYGETIPAGLERANVRYLPSAAAFVKAALESGEDLSEVRTIPQWAALTGLSDQQTRRALKIVKGVYVDCEEFLSTWHIGILIHLPKRQIDKNSPMCQVDRNSTGTGKTPGRKSQGFRFVSFGEARARILKQVIIPELIKEHFGPSAPADEMILAALMGEGDNREAAQTINEAAMGRLGEDGKSDRARASDKFRRKLKSWRYDIANPSPAPPMLEGDDWRSDYRAAVARRLADVQKGAQIERSKIEAQTGIDQRRCRDVMIRAGVLPENHVIRRTLDPSEKIPRQYDAGMKGYPLRLVSQGKSISLSRRRYEEVENWREVNEANGIEVEYRGPNSYRFASEVEIATRITGDQVRRAGAAYQRHISPHYAEVSAAHAEAEAVMPNDQQGRARASERLAAAQSALTPLKEIGVKLDQVRELAQAGNHEAARLGADEVQAALKALRLKPSPKPKPSLPSLPKWARVKASYGLDGQYLWSWFEHHADLFGLRIQSGSITDPDTGEIVGDAETITTIEAAKLLIDRAALINAKLDIPSLDLRILRSLIRRAVPRLQNSPAEALGMTYEAARATWQSLNRDEQEAVMRMVK